GRGGSAHRSRVRACAPTGPTSRHGCPRPAAGRRARDHAGRARRELRAGTRPSEHPTHSLTPVSPSSSPVRVDLTGRPVEPRSVDLDTFFSPRTVAVVGASDSPRRPNTAMTAKIRDWARHAGAEVFLVNPNRDEIDGVTCY